FAPNASSPLWRIPALGGDPVPVTRLDRPRQASHRFPQFLPDGNHFLFFVAGDPDVAGIYLGALDGREPKRLLSTDVAGAYLQPDHVIFMRQGTLVAQRLDLTRGELIGDVRVLADVVGNDNAN